MLKPKIPVKRMVFHEITKDAIQAATEHTRDIDKALVDAQETRRLMDRIFGFEVSPVLWPKVRPGLSAGRVQTPAVRLVVEREWERIAFRSASYWDVIARVAPGFDATLVRLAGQRVAQGRDFDSVGKLKSDVRVVGEAEAKAISAFLSTAGTQLSVADVQAKPGTRSPAKPFTTSTLQQEGGRRLRLSARQVMSLAQSLYENGYITYMRTDSVVLSDQAIAAARAQATKLYGRGSRSPTSPRRYASTSKNAQEAHEAIRPSGDEFRTPQELASRLRGDELKLYELIWKRTVASQMIDARYSTTTVTLTAPVTAEGEPAEFTASGTVWTVPGFRQVYEETSDDADDEEDGRLPDVKDGALLDVHSAEPKGHETEPPARYTEASLVKKLEELGIGRPSTYAAILETIVNRGYVIRKGQALVPEWVAFPAVKLLEDEFGEFVDYGYTAELEEDLDRIAAGQLDREAWLSRFYFGADGKEGSARHGRRRRRGRRPRAQQPQALRYDHRPGRPLRPVPRGRRGRREAADREPARRPPARRAEPREGRGAHRRTAADRPRARRRPGAAGTRSSRRTGGTVRTSPRSSPRPRRRPRRGARRAPSGRSPERPRCSRNMSVETVDLDTALRLLSLPRVVGVDPESGDEITAQNGPLRPVPQEGRRLAVAPERVAALRGDARRRTEDLRRAEAVRSPRGGRAGQGVRPRSGERQADPAARRPIRAVRDRRRDECDDPARRGPGVGRPSSRDRAPPGEARPRPVTKPIRSRAAASKPKTASRAKK